MLSVLSSAACVLWVASPGPMTLKSVTLYKNGLGYYERTAQAAPSQELEIPLGPGQLSDAVKSLVVLGNRSVASVDYSSPTSARAERGRLGKVTVENEDTGEETTLRVGDLPELANQLRGEEVEVLLKKGTRLVGKVVEVSTRAVSEEGAESDEKAKESATLILSGPQGIAALSFDDISFLKPRNAAIQQAMERLAAAEGAVGYQQNLKVRAGKGEGPLRLGYLTEAPVWTISYRLSVTGNKARLLAFANVHNDSNEAWNDIDLTVATGQPVSVVSPVAGPRYARRSIQAVDDNLDDVPQLVTAEARSLMNGERVDVVRRDVTLQVSDMSRYGYGSGSGGFGMRGGSAGTHGYSVAVMGGRRAEEGSELLESPWAPLSPVEPESVGDYTLYRAKEKVTMKPHSSGLVPILDVEIPAQLVVVLKKGSFQTAVRLVNDTKFPFEPGPLSVFDGNTFVGETSMSQVFPKGIFVSEVAPSLDIQGDVEKTEDYGPIEFIQKDDEQSVSLHRLHTATYRIKLQSRARVDRIVLLPLNESGHRLKDSTIEEDVRSMGERRFARWVLKKGEKSELSLADVGAVKRRQEYRHINLQWLKDEKFAARVEPQRQVLEQQVMALEATKRQVDTLSRKVAENEKAIAAVKDQIDLLSKAGAKTQVELLAQKLIGLEADKAILEEQHTQSKRMHDEKINSFRL